MTGGATVIHPKTNITTGTETNTVPGQMKLFRNTIPETYGDSAQNSKSRPRIDCRRPAAPRRPANPRRWSHTWPCTGLVIAWWPGSAHRWTKNIVWFLFCILLSSKNNPARGLITIGPAGSKYIRLFFYYKHETICDHCQNDSFTHGFLTWIVWVHSSLSWKGQRCTEHSFWLHIVVIPVQTGIQYFQAVARNLDSRLHGNDGIIRRLFSL